MRVVGFFFLCAAHPYNCAVHNCDPVYTARLHSGFACVKLTVIDSFAVDCQCFLVVDGIRSFLFAECC